MSKDPNVLAEATDAARSENGKVARPSLPERLEGRDLRLWLKVQQGVQRAEQLLQQAGKLDSQAQQLRLEAQQLIGAYNSTGEFLFEEFAIDGDTDILEPDGAIKRGALIQGETAPS